VSRLSSGISPRRSAQKLERSPGAKEIVDVVTKYSESRMCSIIPPLLLSQTTLVYSTREYIKLLQCLEANLLEQKRSSLGVRDGRC
jgi:hypothetical protein